MGGEECAEDGGEDAANRQCGKEQTRMPGGKERLAGALQAWNDAANPQQTLSSRCTSKGARDNQPGLLAKTSMRSVGDVMGS